MSERVIPLVDQRHPSHPLPAPSLPQAMAEWPLDRLQRPLHDLRISVTDRCNFRCSYCMPKEVFDKDYTYLPHSALLSFEEITRTASLFVQRGVRKIRLTGGEPLLRKNIEILISQLAALRTPDGQPLDLTLTTNGSLLARKAQALRDAGLQRVTVSLDGLDDTVFRRMNDVDFPVAEVLEGIARLTEMAIGDRPRAGVAGQDRVDQRGDRADGEHLHHRRQFLAGRGADRGERVPAEDAVGQLLDQESRAAAGRSAQPRRHCHQDQTAPRLQSIRHR